ncbi:MAG: RNA polymerase sigma factor, partial [Pseudomonadota bacterium]
EQRLTYIIGEIFEAPSQVAADVLGVSAATFRKRLERACADLVAFMNDKCGLVNRANPCRCERKTQAFIAQWWVDTSNRKFAHPHLQNVRQSAAQSATRIDELVYERYAALFREHPRYHGPDVAKSVADMLRDPSTRSIFDLDPDHTRHGV